LNVKINYRRSCNQAITKLVIQVTQREIAVFRSAGVLTDGAKASKFKHLRLRGMIRSSKQITKMSHLKPAPLDERVGTTTAHSDRFEITAELDGLKVKVPVYRTNICALCTNETKLVNYGQLVEFLKKNNIGYCCSITLCSGPGKCSRITRKRSQTCPICQQTLNLINLS
jgi:hypothetical protein